METLVVAAHLKHQYYTTKSGSHGLVRFNSSPPNRFQEINRQTSLAADGILPFPLRASSIPVIKQTPPSPKTPPRQQSTERGCFKPVQKSSPIPIRTKSVRSEKYSNEGFFDGSLSFSERWAGPTYSNSPPPSSLPVPKFLQLPKRTNSLDSPSVVSNSDVSVHPISKSAPNSPTREFSPPPLSKDLSRSADTATVTLRRILNLEPYDE